ncbi:UNVERIFIED_CONTAM: hypothetical protein Slati_2019500 [Sesamum latifolium]|uniref:Bifunctional inhibitor/plant lipid transfer protein/seed storage helical domain-containing protein n=1 Tax=Sesamum latifolium TaxID=2727402 RepID=A0AAW2WNJ9_9LAMI
MSRKVVYCLLWAMVLQVLAQSWSHANAFSCREASNLLSPCLAYLMGGYSSPTAECCQGVSALKDTVKGKADLRSCCECMKEDASGFHFIPESAAALPTYAKSVFPCPLTLKATVVGTDDACLMEVSCKDPVGRGIVGFGSGHEPGECNQLPGCPDEADALRVLFAWLQQLRVGAVLPGSCVVESAGGVGPEPAETIVSVPETDSSLPASQCR